MEILLITLGLILIILGILGCFLPIIPGPPLSFVAIVLLKIAYNDSVSNDFLLLWGSLVGVVTILDYIVPVLGTKLFGGSKLGTRGSTIGLIVGIFLGPFGIIAGPFVGAFIGELIGGKNVQDSLKAGLGSFLGFIAGTFAKLVVSGMLAFYFIKISWNQISPLISNL